MMRYGWNPRTRRHEYFRDDFNASDNAGELSIDTDGELSVGIGGGLGIDTDGDLTMKIAPGISIDLTDHDDGNNFGGGFDPF